MTVRQFLSQTPPFAVVVPLIAALQVVDEEEDETAGTLDEEIVTDVLVVGAEDIG